MSDYTKFAGCPHFKFKPDAGYGSSLPIKPSPCCGNCIHWDWPGEYCRADAREAERCKAKDEEAGICKARDEEQS